MKIIKEVFNKAGGRRVTFDLSANESIKIVRDNAYYKLGGQVEDVVQSHVVLDSAEVYWCSIGQEWVRS